LLYANAAAALHVATPSGAPPPGAADVRALLAATPRAD
jgi:hypothetical protein